MKIKILIIVLAIALLCAGIGVSSAAEEVQQQTYVPKTIIDVPWGDKPEEFGLFKGSPYGGARTFTIDRKGNIYIYDHVKGFVKKFDKNGTYEENIGPVTRGSSLAIGINGHIFILRGHNVDEYLKNGNLIKTHIIAGDIELIPGYGSGIKFDDWENLHVSYGYTLYAVGRVVSGKFEALSHKEQKASKRRGDPSNRKDRRIKTKVTGKELAVLQILDDDGNILKQISMHTAGYFGGVQVLKQNKDNFIYIETERISSDNYVHLEVRKVDVEGKCCVNH